jgi:hypothetical protein
VEVELRGTGLEGTYAVWLGPGTRLVSLDSPAGTQATKGPDGIEAHVQGVPDGSRAKVRLVMAPDARVGFHSLSLVSPRGVSRPVPFWVGTHAVIQGTAAPHGTPRTAQPVKLPVAVNGRLPEGGQLDYYAFAAAREQTVAFEVVSSHEAAVAAHLAVQPELALYEAGGSFLDPERSRRLLFREELTQGSMPAGRRMTYHFARPGRYLVSYGSRFARGKGGHSYLLRMSPIDESAAVEGALPWARRRLQHLLSRAVGPPAAEVGLVREAEPNDHPDQAKAFEVPAVLEGTIGQPGDVDRFRFKARAGERLAFEVRTPRAGPPHFNLRLDVLDAKGAVVLTNLHVRDGKVGTEAAKVIGVDREVLGKLEKEGEYTLRLRGLTSLHGSPDHAYEILVRPQVPHVGDARLSPAGPVNLPAGGRRRLTVAAPGKEGYAGSLALSVEGLPPGVRAFVGTNGTTIDLVADASAPRGSLPRVLRIWGLPLAGGKSGTPFLVAEVPVMVVKG